MRKRGLLLQLILLLSFPLALCAEEPIRIGAIFSMSSWGADGGNAECNGALMAVEDINARGGVNGRPLKLVVEDNASDLKATASAFVKLANVDKVPAIVGPNWTEFAEVAAPLSESARVVFVSPSGFKEQLFSGKKYAFTLWPPLSVATRPLSQYVAENFKRVPVLLSANGYLEGTLDAIKEQVQGANVALEPVMRFNQGQLDYRSAISALKRSEADAVLALLIENSDLAGFFRQARELKLGLPLLTANGIPFDETIQKDRSIAEGVIFFDYLPAGSGQFRARYHERFKREAGFASAKAYDAVFLLKEAIEKCSLEREAIQRCLRAARYRGVSGVIAFDGDGVITAREDNSRLLRVQGGQFVAVSKERR